MGYENRYSGAIAISPPLTRSQINDPRIARRTDVALRIVDQKVESDDGESYTVRPVADAIVPLDKEYSGHSLEDDIQLIIDTFPEHGYAGFIEAQWDPGFGEPPSRFIVKDDRVMRIDAQYRWPGIWPDEPEEHDEPPPRQMHADGLAALELPVADETLGLRTRIMTILHSERLADAVLAEIDDEAIDRMARHYIDETHIKALEIRNGANLELKPAQDMVALWVAAARTMLGDAENYSETPVGLPSVSMDVKLAGEYESFTLTVQRAGKLTPHQARVKAEEERDDARALAKALFDRMRDFVPDDAVFGEGISWETLPDWMTSDGTGRALWAYGAEGDDD